ncbi:DUF5789 family protein [Natronobiforma cellulositropha]|uniref:DUF5789 family protein n=1 Tax=Natronobiforma cellulositropha TaxID=1679076 RepID=UPI0021D5FA06|nr:hypothetical protein [Natronobiforma cellulositropha]
MSDEHDPSEVTRQANERRSSRAESTETVLEDVERRLGDIEYPVSGEELATEYALDEIDLPNETESLGSVFDRLATERFDSSAEIRETVLGEVTGEAGDPNEANPERDLERLDEHVSERGSDAR